MAHLFVSYASTDQAIATEVCALLEARGVSCWIAPRDVAPGSKWDETLLHAIDEAGAFLLLLSTASNDSPFVQNEVNRAFSKKKAIFTFRIEDVAPAGSLEFYLARHHWTDGFGARIEPQVDQLAASVTALVGAASVAAVAAPVAQHAPSTQRQATRRRKLDWRRSLPWAITATAVAALTGVAAVHFSETPPAPRPVLRLPVTLGADANPMGIVSFALSPDETHIAMLVRRGERTPFVLRAFDGTDVRQLSPGDAGDAAFSRDGQWLAYVTEGKVWKVPVQGGAPLALCDVVNPRGVGWGDGFLIVAADRTGGLSRCPDAGGSLTPVTTRAQGSDRWPQVLPGNGAVLFTRSDGTGFSADRNEIVVQRFGSAEQKTLWKGGTYGRYLPSGHLVFVAQNTLFAVRMDLQRLEISGAPKAVVEDVGVPNANDFAMYDVSPGGTFAMIPQSTAARPRTILRLDTSGRTEPLVPGEGFVSGFSFSPDGTHGTFTGSTPSGSGLWMYEFDRDTRSRLVQAYVYEPGAQWTRDARFLFFLTRTGQGAGIAAVRADGSADATQLLVQAPIIDRVSISADTRTLIYGSGGALWLLPIDVTGQVPRKTGEPSLFLRNAGAAQFSPDGRWVSYGCNDSGRLEICVRPYPGPGPATQVSTDGVTRDARSRWSRNGKALFYVNASRQLMRVAYTESAATFSVSKPLLIATLEEGWSLEDVAADEKSFAILAPAAQRQRQMTFILNFFDQLKQLVPAN